jgi:hypothetical protein
VRPIATNIELRSTGDCSGDGAAGKAGGRVDPEQRIEVPSLLVVIDRLAEGDLHAKEDPDCPEHRRPQVGDGGQVNTERQREDQQGDYSKWNDDAHRVAEPALDGEVHASDLRSLAPEAHDAFSNWPNVIERRRPV